MVIRVKLFAIVRERAGVGDLSLELTDRATVADAARALGERLPAISAYLARCAFAVNQSYVPSATELRDGDELAVIPPVSGG